MKNYREARRLVGLCPQEFNVDPFAKPADIVDWAAGYFGMNRAQRKSRVDYLMERFELTPHLKKSFRELSGGLKRRVVLARALVHDPKLIILDEPTAGVDVELRRVLWNYLTEINQDGRTILLTSHYLEEVERLCRDIAIVAKGRIVREGTKDEMAATPGSLEHAYLVATGARSRSCRGAIDERARSHDPWASTGSASTPSCAATCSACCGCRSRSSSRPGVRRCCSSSCSAMCWAAPCAPSAATNISSS